MASRRVAYLCTCFLLGLAACKQSPTHTITLSFPDQTLAGATSEVQVEVFRAASATDPCPALQMERSSEVALESVFRKRVTFPFTGDAFGGLALEAGPHVVVATAWNQRSPKERFLRGCLARELPADSSLGLLVPLSEFRGCCQAAGCLSASELDCYDGPGSPPLGECRAGKASCKEGYFGHCEKQVLPQAESCNGRDDDCNGVVDDLPACTPIGDAGPRDGAGAGDTCAAAWKSPWSSGCFTYFETKNPPSLAAELSCSTDYVEKQCWVGKWVEPLASGAAFTVEAELQAPAFFFGPNPWDAAIVVYFRNQTSVQLLHHELHYEVVVWVAGKPETSTVTNLPHVTSDYHPYKIVADPSWFYFYRDGVEIHKVERNKPELLESPTRIVFGHFNGACGTSTPVTQVSAAFHARGFKWNGDDVDLACR